MHRLEITGETPDALYMNVISTLALFLRGGSQQTMPVEPATDATPAGAGPKEGSQSEGSSPSVADQAVPKKRGRPAKV